MMTIKSIATVICVITVVMLGRLLFIVCSQITLKGHVEEEEEWFLSTLPRPASNQVGLPLSTFFCSARIKTNIISDIAVT